MNATKITQIDAATLSDDSKLDGIILALLEISEKLEAIEERLDNINYAPDANDPFNLRYES